MTMMSTSNTIPNSSMLKTGAASAIGLASITRQPTGNHTTILSSRNHFRIMKMVMARTPEKDSCQKKMTKTPYTMMVLSNDMRMSL